MHASGESGFTITPQPGRRDRACTSYTLQPAVIAFNGLQGYRHAVDARALVGMQAKLIAGRPVMVTPSSSARAGGAISYPALLSHWKALRIRVELEVARRD